MSGRETGVRFGTADAEEPDWREAELELDDDDSDEEPAEFPADVAAMLGFDPSKEEE